MVSKSALDLQENVLKPFAVAEGDLLTHLNVYRAFVDQPEKKRASWAGRHQLNYRVLQRALAIRAQLARLHIIRYARIEYVGKSQSCMVVATRPTRAPRAAIWDWAHGTPSGLAVERQSRLLALYGCVYKSSAAYNHA